MLVKNNRNFIKDRITRSQLRILGDNLLTSDGAFWRRQRRLAQPAFHRERIENYARTVVSYTERMLEDWHDGEERDVHRDMMRLTIIMAGHETTAIALSWTWHLLGMHPAAEEKLRTELEVTLNGRLPTITDLLHLPYKDAVIKESMRLYPPAWAIGREALEDCEIGGFHVSAKTQMFISQYVVHHDPRFFENPETFSPERWLDDHEKRLPKLAYSPSVADLVSASANPSPRWRPPCYSRP